MRDKLDDNLDEISRCVDEFGDRIQLMGCLLAKRVQLEGMLAANHAAPCVGPYGEDAFKRLKTEIDSLVGSY